MTKPTEEQIEAARKLGDLLSNEEWLSAVSFDHTVTSGRVYELIAQFLADREAKSEIPQSSLSTFKKAEQARITDQKKLPQPNYATLKVAEESREIIQAAVHYAKKRVSCRFLMIVGCTV